MQNLWEKNNNIVFCQVAMNMYWKCMLLLMRNINDIHTLEVILGILYPFALLIINNNNIGPDQTLTNYWIRLNIMAVLTINWITHYKSIKKIIGKRIK